MNIVVVGGGSIGKRHLRNLKELNLGDLFCFRRSLDSSFEEEFFCTVLTQLDEVKKLHPDVLIVCNPTALHLEWIELANQLDIHLFVEKPMVDLESSLDRIKKSKPNNKVFFIGFMMRFHPLVKKIKELLEGDKIGEVYSARLEFGSFLPYWHPWEDYKDSYASKKELGGGVINTITHELDLAQYFFGEPKKISTIKSNFNNIGIEVEEIAESTLIYNDKLVTLHVDFLQQDYDRRITILGSKGKISWNWHDNLIEIELHKSFNEKIELQNFDVNQLYIDELKEFFELIERKCTEHELNLDHAINNTQLMIDMHKSADLGKVIEL